MAGCRPVSTLESGHRKYFSDLGISHRTAWKSRTSRTKEIDNMELLVQWLLFVLGDDGPLESVPAPGGRDIRKFSCIFIFTSAILSTVHRGCSTAPSGGCSAA